MGENISFIDDRVYYILETIAEYGTRGVIIDIQAWSFTRVNSLRLQS